VYSYEEVLNHYRRLLAEHPGEALTTGNGIAVLLDPRDGELVWGEFVGGPDVVDVTTLAEFDNNAWDEYSWDGETPEQTAADIHQPRFVMLPPHFAVPVLEKGKGLDSEPALG